MKIRVISFIFLILTAIIMLFAISGCGNTDNTPTDGVKDTTSEPTATITIKGETYGTDLTELDLTNKELENSDIEPLKHMTNLTGLYLSYNKISDISALSGLTNLAWLDLSLNQISDISALSGLTNLTRLELSYNPIIDISALRGLTNLTELSLYSNQISDISALSGLTNLTALWLYNPVTEEQIAELQAALPDCKITVSIMAEIEKKDEIELPKTITVKGETYSVDLTELNLFGKELTNSDVEPLKYMTNLTTLDLSYNQISDISALSGLTNLTELILFNNQISDISALNSLTNLTALYLSFNSITEEQIAELQAALPDCGIVF